MNDLVNINTRNASIITAWENSSERSAFGVAHYTGLNLKEVRNAPTREAAEAEAFAIAKHGYAGDSAQVLGG